MIRELFLAFGLTIAQAVAVQSPPQTGSIALLPADEPALDATICDLCGRQVALLGETSNHGDGHTEAFKVALVQQLVRRCHFTAIAFESRRYEFIAVDRAMRDGTATPSMIADAVGGLWKFDREFGPLTGFLFDEARAGRLRLAGLDAQLGGLGEDFTNDRMVPELTGRLPYGEAGTCIEAFARHAAWAYPADHPYGPAEHERLLACAAAMRRTLDADPDTDARTRTERDTMIDNVEWAIHADLDAVDDQHIARERWLYRNFATFVATLPGHAKVIVWGATAHLAKNAEGVLTPANLDTFGSLVHRDYGRRAFTLGFSATGGRYRVSRKALIIERPPTLSLEATALADSGGGTAYLDRHKLNSLGVIAGGGLEHGYHTVNWSDVVDGMVIFRSEWPSHNTRPGYYLGE